VAEADGSGVGVGTGVPAGLVVGPGVAVAVAAARLVLGVGVGLGLAVPVGVAVGDGWMALAPVLAARGIQRGLLATAACAAPSRTSALKRWPSEVLAGRTKTALNSGVSGAEATVVHTVPDHLVRFTISPGRPEGRVTRRRSLSGLDETSRRTGLVSSFFGLALGLAVGLAAW
jgi:hypothetical protein